MTIERKWNGSEWVMTGGNATLSTESPAGMVGEVKMIAFDTPPIGWLLCDGQAVSRSTYSALFSAIGIGYGEGDGSTTFNLPDLTDRVPRGNATASGSGSDSVTLSSGQLAAHTHSGPSHTHSGPSHRHKADLVVVVPGLSDPLPDSWGDSTMTSRWNTIRVADGTRYESYGAGYIWTEYNGTGNTGSGGTGNTGSTGSGTSIDITPSHTNLAFIIYTGV
jgi:microcystin-dependent protein